MTKDTIKQIIINNLNLSGRKDDITLSTPLLGAIPELDSMAVVGIITAMEDSFGITIYDDEISAESFETLGSLVTLVEKKINE